MQPPALCLPASVMLYGSMSAGLRSLGLAGPVESTKLSAEGILVTRPVSVFSSSATSSRDGARANYNECHYHEEWRGDLTWDTEDRRLSGCLTGQALLSTRSRWGSQRRMSQ